MINTSRQRPDLVDVQHLPMTAGKQGGRGRRGSIYVLVLGAATIVTVIGLSALLAARIQHRAARGTSDLAQARLCAVSAIDMALYTIDRSSGAWQDLDDIRDLMQSNPVVNQSIGPGKFNLQATAVDENGDNNTDYLLLTGIGYAGGARFKLQVTLAPDGSVLPGTWRQTVD